MSRKKSLTTEEEIKRLKTQVNRNSRYCKMNHKYITDLYAEIALLKEEVAKKQ